METYNYLLVWRDKLKRLLDNSTAVHLQSQGEDVPTDALGQGEFLLQATKLEEERTAVVRQNETLEKLPCLKASPLLPGHQKQKLSARRARDSPQRTSG